MKNISILWGNKVDAAVLSLGSWVASLPLSNLQERELSLIARSTDLQLSSTKFKIQFSGRLPSVGGIALVDHNLSSDAKWRITASNAAGTKVRQTDWVSVWPEIDPGALDWEEDIWWTGKQDSETISNYTRLALWCGGADLWPVYDDVSNPAIWTVEIDDQLSSAGHVDIGRLFIGRVFVPTENYSWGARLSVVDPSDIKSGFGYVEPEFYVSKKPRRVMRVGFSALTDSEAYGVFALMHTQLGLVGEVIVSQDYSDPSFYLQRTIYGRMRMIGDIENISSNRHKVDFEVIEVI